MKRALISIILLSKVVGLLSRSAEWKPGPRISKRYFWILISFSFVILVACPPPSYKFKFIIDNELREEAVIKEDSLSLIVKGFHTPRSSLDYIFLELHFKGTEKEDSAFCSKVIELESNRYERSTYDLIQSTGCNCYFNLYYDHKNFSEMSASDFSDYLDSTYVRIFVKNIFKYSYEIYPVFDRKWLAKRLSTNLKNENME